jgi:hypothetical protein
VTTGRCLPTGVSSGYSLILDINDHVQELNRWAMSEHVKKANDGIKFNRVVRGP